MFVDGDIIRPMNHAPRGADSGMLVCLRIKKPTRPRSAGHLSVDETPRAIARDQRGQERLECTDTPESSQRRSDTSRWGGVTQGQRCRELNVPTPRHGRHCPKLVGRKGDTNVEATLTCDILACGYQGDSGGGGGVGSLIGTRVWHIASVRTLSCTTHKDMTHAPDGLHHPTRPAHTWRPRRVATSQQTNDGREARASSAH